MTLLYIGSALLLLLFLGVPVAFSLAGLGAALLAIKGADLLVNLCSPGFEAFSAELRQLILQLLQLALKFFAALFRLAQCGRQGLERAVTLVEGLNKRARCQ